MSKYIDKFPPSLSFITQSVYEKINESENTNTSKHQIPVEFVEHIAANTASTTRILAGNFELMKKLPTQVVGGISINSVDKNIFKMHNTSIPVFDLDTLSRDSKKAVEDLRSQLALYKKDKKIKLKCVGNLPFKGEGDKLWQLLLDILTEAGFDEIHIIIPASGINSKEMKQASFDGLKSIHFIRPERWLDDKGKYEIGILCALIEIHKDYIGEVSVFDDFLFLYSRPLYNSKGRQNFFAPIAHWPEIEDILIQQHGSNDFIFDQKIYSKNFAKSRLEPRFFDQHKTFNDAVVGFDINGPIYGVATVVDRWYKKGITANRVIAGNSRGLGIIDDLILVGDKPIAVKQAQWFEPETPNSAPNLISLLQTDIAKSLIIATTPNATNALNTPAFRLLSAFDLTQTWDNNKLESLFKPAHVTALKEVSTRYKAIYK
jgi:hypothetical protein